MDTGALTVTEGHFHGGKKKLNNEPFQMCLKLKL